MSVLAWRAFSRLRRSAFKQYDEIMHCSAFSLANRSEIDFMTQESHAVSIVGGSELRESQTLRRVGIAM